MRLSLIALAFSSATIFSFSTFADAATPNWLNRCGLLLTSYVLNRPDPHHLTAISGRMFSKMREVKNLEELKAFPIGDQGVNLVTSMESDIFFRSKPFSELSDLTPVAKVLARGVQRFDRTIYRTALNVRSWNNGYDLVHYKITHFDGSSSVLFAYKKESTSATAMGVGLHDGREMLQNFYISEGNGSVSAYQYKNGSLEIKFKDSIDIALAKSNNFIEASIKMKLIYKLNDPSDYIF